MRNPRSSFSPDIPEKPSSPALAVRLRGVDWRYGDNLLFENVTLDLPGGGFTCLLGPSGVGKSTLLRLLAGLLPTTRATVTCSDGLPLTGRVAYMAQQDLLLPWLTVLDNVLLGNRLRGETPAVDKAHELLRRVGLADVTADRPAALSGGMRQRVALARTLMEDRPVVLMDEPFSGVDALTRLRLQTLAAVTLRQRTVLLVTHDPLEAVRLARQVLIMHGRPVRLQLFEQPLSESTPRDPGDPSVQSAYRELLRRLEDESCDC
ncbi:MAG: ABC transporter ATP-binding protein [Gammaproteobacteria bacterium]|nr:ABC transporter ATP-binding protein [Gammaproteobacteria bacterium]MCP5424229.1 ABC transporter ATP-binding protein [Gammaproteobacteria bacterium]MCP5458897.1 ABC transporter ATP-binding protein [Gammaproteobacteria bacterium]